MDKKQAHHLSWDYFCPYQASFKQLSICCSTVLPLLTWQRASSASSVPPYECPHQKLPKWRAAKLRLCLLVKHKSSDWRPLSPLLLWCHVLATGHLAWNVDGWLNNLKQNPTLQTCAAMGRYGTESSQAACWRKIYWASRKGLDCLDVTYFLFGILNPFS